MSHESTLWCCRYKRLLAEQKRVTKHLSAADALHTHATSDAMFIEPPSFLKEYETQVTWLQSSRTVVLAQPFTVKFHMVFSL